MSAEWWRRFFDEDFLQFHRDRPYQNTQQEINLLTSILGKPEGRLLLDTCCGPGRHAVPLASMGWRVVGLDTSKVLLNLARETSHRDIPDGKKRPVWVCGDLRAPPLGCCFDAAICMWTSLGFCEKESDHLRMLVSVHRSLKPGGIFVVDLANRDCLIGQKGTLRNWWKREDAYVLEETFFDPITSVARTVNTIVGLDGTEKTTEYRVRLYSLHEIVDYLFEAGFSIEKGYGGYDGSPLMLTTPRIILVCRK